MRQPLGVHELPDRAVVDFQAALAQFRDKAAQGEILLPAAPHKPVAKRPGYLAGLVAADLSGRHAAGLIEQL